MLEYLRSGPGLWENRSPSHVSKSGVSDITGCLNGRFIAIELKHPKTGRKSDVTAAQRRYLNEVVDNGGYALATNSFEGVQSAFALWTSGSYIHPGFIEDFRK